MIGVRLEIAKRSIGRFKPNSVTENLYKLIVKAKNVVRKISEHFLDTATKIICSPVVTLLILISFLKPFRI